MTPALDTAVVPVRADVAVACTDAWSRVGRAGTWFSGATHVAVAAAARDARACRLCALRREAVSPYAVDGSHDGSARLAAEVVDAVHRLAVDSRRVSRRWYDDVTAVLSPAELVEVVALVANVTALDTLCAGIGAPPAPLPAPQPGEPRRVLPEGAVVSTSRVPTVPIERATGALAVSLGRSGATLRSDGETGGYRPRNIVFALTLVPDEQVHWRRMSATLYRNPVFALSDAERELVATTVSSFNDCFY